MSAELKEALAHWDGHSRFLAEPAPYIRTIVEAARRVAEADEVWWCEVHRSPTGDRLIDGASKCFLAVDEGLWAYACRFKGRLLLPAEEGE